MSKALLLKTVLMLKACRELTPFNPISDSKSPLMWTSLMGVRAAVTSTTNKVPMEMLLDKSSDLNY